MRIDLLRATSALLALLVAACADIPDPRPQASMPPGDDDSMQPDEPDQKDGANGGQDPPIGEWVPPPIVRRSCEVEGQAIRDGSAVPSGDSCNSCSCFDGTVYCTELVCEPASCEASAQEPDGVCSPPPEDPCIQQDPDCSETPPEPGPDEVVCEAAAQSFAEGDEIPSGDSCNTCSCVAGAVRCTENACDPVFCAEFVEEPDGACARFPLDPCITQDPDCASAPLPSAP